MHIDAYLNTCQTTLTLGQNQLRLNAFFSIPSMPHNSSSGSPTHDAQSPLSSRRTSISENHTTETSRRSRSISVTPQKSRLSEYEIEFKPFYVPSNTALAPYNQFSRDEEGLAFLRSKVDGHIRGQVETKPPVKEQGNLSLIESFQLPPNTGKRQFHQTYSVKEIMQQVEGTTLHPIDLTARELKKATKNPLDLLAKVPMKVLKFREDVRPPYVGTYTRLQGAKSISHLARNPFSRDLPKTNYDYDSEAEWEEPVEGEDLESEGEEEDDEDEEGDEMAAFLDDEGASEITRTLKRRPVHCDQLPVCTGLCWDGPEGCDLVQAMVKQDWRLLKLDILMGELLQSTLAYQKADLLETPRLPIDPYSSIYWQSSTSSASLQTTPNAQSRLMEPPRFPLHPVNRQNTLLSVTAPAKTAGDLGLNLPISTKHTRTQRHIAPELMDEFKTVVQGNDLTKVGLLEILKKKSVHVPLASDFSG